MNRPTSRGSSARPHSDSKQLRGGVLGHRAVVRAVRDERVVVVDDGEHAGAQRNGFSRQPFGVPRPIPALMMAFDVGRDGIRERHRADDVRADLRVDAHALELVGRQPAGLRKNVLGDRQLADVVQQRGHLHAFHFVRRHACRAGELRGSRLHAADVVVVRPMRSIEGLVRASIARASASTLARCRSDTCFRCRS